MRFSTLALFAVAAAGSVAGNVVVSTRTQGDFVGLSNELGDQFFGIPYAQAPVGPLRFNKPKQLPRSHGTRVALEHGPACMQQPFLPGSRFSEDCLTINIYRPPAAARKRPLPVLIWIHPGSWQVGSNSAEPFSDLTNLVARSVRLGEPIIIVSINYRLGAFGFISGPDVDAADAAGTAVLNAGYWDQREAIKFTKANIAAFGGDPAKLTLHGQSSGANSVAAQMLANGGRVGNLFRGAILESGSQATAPRLKATDDSPTRAYQLLLKQTGCTDLKSLRNLPAQKLLDGQLSVMKTFGVQPPFTPVRDRYFVQELPSAQFAAGRFPKIPFITGNNLDEGTLFKIKDVTNDAGFDAIAVSMLGGQAVKPVLPQLRALYPDDPAVGSPFDAPLLGKKSSERFYDFLGINQYKRVAALLGDGLFQAGRRQQLQASTPRVNCWSYHFTQPSPDAILKDPASGVTHSAEVAFMLSQPPAPYTGPVIDPASRAAAANAGPADLKRTSDLLSAAFVHFANRLSPAGRDVPSWPTYGSQANTLQIQGTNGTKVVVDDYRKPQIQFFLDHPETFSI